MAIVTDRSSPQIWRTQIVLLTAEGRGTMELTRRTGTSKTSVWRWQERFRAKNNDPSSAIVALGQQGLIRDPGFIATCLHDNQRVRSNPASVPKLNQRPEARLRP